MTTTPATSPALHGPPRLISAVILVDTSRENAQDVLDALARQNCRPDELEVVVYDMAGDGALPLRMPSGFRVRHVKRPWPQYWRVARARAARETSGDVIAFLEDHCNPDPGWAAALLSAYRSQRWAAVGYTFRNGSRDSWWSRSALVADYGRFLHPQTGGPAPFLAGNNVSYARWFLEEIGSAFEETIAVDYNWHQEITARGHSMTVASDATAAHRCYADLATLCAANFQYVRVLGTARATAAQWNTFTRTTRAAAAALLVPPLRLARLARDLWPRERGFLEFLAALPAVWPVYAAAACGEACGYLAGLGDAEERFVHWELNTSRIA
jgi:hypothetical protein